MAGSARNLDTALPAHPGVLGSTAMSNPPSDVNVNRRTAHRFSDGFNCLQGHFPNSVIDGSGTVWFNSHPAARVNDAIACGATIGVGSTNVNIGGGNWASDVARIGNITVRGSPAFIRRVRADLTALRATPDGRRTLDSLTNVTIVEFTGPNSYAMPTNMGDAYAGPFMNGRGSPAIVGYNPNLTLQAPAAGGGFVPTPSFLVLGHELIHAGHMNHGTTEPSDEDQTIGLGSHANDSPTENSIRRQAGPQLGQRSSHSNGILGPGQRGPVR